MSGNSTIAVTGKVEVATVRKTTKDCINQAIDGIEAKELEVTIPHGGTSTPVPLGLSTGITEALFVRLYCALPLVIELTSSDVLHPGPFRMGFKGEMMLTLTPGEGIIGINLVNADTADDAVVQVAIAALGNPTDKPTFWYPPAQ